MSDSIFQGGCFCGAIRYRVAGIPRDVCHCHCADCRRASGAAFVSWASFHADGFAFTRGEPGAFRYAGRVRTFCRMCGTSLTFREETLAEIDVTLASLDEPGAMVPEDHIWTEDQLPWIALADGLPRHARGRTD